MEESTGQWQLVTHQRGWVGRIHHMVIMEKTMETTIGYLGFRFQGGH